MAAPTSVRYKLKPSYIGGNEVTLEVTEGQMRKEFLMENEGRVREKRNVWLFITNIILLTIMHISLTLGHSLDSLAAEHGRPRPASA
jgi:hypothetical protein